ncbi:hypothetical protein [Flammeovirga sp. SJP92]|uniref:hypothetical protein n=1 Tax=Flammeovirga sp. SJP92 TaxID=1775430 RepID=UPI00078936B7|nr:hypothetical protein [Flammeovirga sp. SJP92]KXX72018.1 hypothetical protein AVL50_04345 [Flammeovirga sp. SJP92]
MWSRIKKLIHHKSSNKEILKNISLHLEKEAEHLYHLQMSLKSQVLTLQGKADNIQKHIKKNQFDIKAAIGNEQRSKAMELNNYGNTLKKERDHYVKSVKDLEIRLLDTSSKISILQVQKEKVSTQLMFIKSNHQSDAFDVEKFLYDVFNEEEQDDFTSEEELLSMEIDLALEQTKEADESEEKIQQFFDEIEPKKESKSAPKKNNESLIDSFFSKTKQQTSQEKKIDDFFNKK